jgi:hypothetical protein
MILFKKINLLKGDDYSKKTAYSYNLKGGKFYEE